VNSMESIYIEIDMIEDYLNNTASKEKVRELNQRLDNERELRMLFDDMESIMAGIELSAGRSTVDEKIKILDTTLTDLDIDQESDGNEKSKYGGEGKTISVSWHERPIMRAVAAFFLLLLISVIVLGPMGSKTDEQLFAENFVAHANYGGVRGLDEDEIVSKSRQAFQAYDIGDYATAVTLLEEVIPDSEEEIVNKFYLGNAYMALGDGKEASILFRELVDRNEGFALDAKWYLALSYLQMGKSEEARKELNEIVEIDNDYKNEAREILRKMKK